MTIVWAVNSFSDKFNGEFTDLNKAVMEAELHIECELIKWLVEPNLPGLQPDTVWKALRLYTWTKYRGWRATSIHGYESSSWAEHPLEDK